MSDLPSIPRGPHPSSRTWVHTPVRVAVAGVTGYAGAELARLLLRHPRFASTPPLFLGRMLDPGLDTGLGQGFTPDKKTTPEPTPGLGQGFSPDKTSSPEKGLQPRPEPTPGLGEGFSPHTPIRPEATPLTQLHPQLSGLPHADSLDVLPWDWDLLAAERIDLLFLATPHEQARAWAP
ncbi:MAG TPA: hypothetical protein VM865_04160, partial [Acidobacteriaceae bacterium]|nr:hypothetical protein [Acidobacteriaceae bacterium]